MQILNIYDLQVLSELINLGDLRNCSEVRFLCLLDGKYNWFFVVFFL